MRIGERIEDCVWEWAGKTPDAVAITDRGRQITYRELADQAGALSERLQRCGTGPDVLVALSAERSADMVAGLVAILRSGAAYVPIDPSYPDERRALLLEDSQCPIVVTQKQFLETFRAHTGSLIVLDDPAADRIGEQRPLIQPNDDPLAYIIYTSGSTGKPKGVQITQRNVVRLFEQTQAWYGFDQSDVWSLFHSFAFDVSVFEIWGAFRYGGRLVVVPYEVTRDPIAFRALVREERVTVLSQTPSAFRMFLAADELVQPAGADALRYVIFAGEALDFRLLRPWFERHGDQRPVMVNMYGTTETTVHATYREVQASDAANPRSLVGVPIPDLTLELRDARGNATPMGEEGEIWIGGAGVGRGYFHRPELTAERFVGGLYRTGDLAREGGDGEWEYLGRIDHQVKLRGFRIELGEVEAMLRAAPGVSDAVVTLRTDGQGEAFLAGYLVPRHAQMLDLSAVSAHAKRQLPGYMCPWALLVLEALPLNANGKLDRKALPAPPSAVQAADEAGELKGGTEERIARAFREVLGMAAVGARSNFFALGGTSLQAMVLALRITREFRVTLPAGTVFRHPDVRGLASAVDAAQPVVAATAAEDQDWHPLSYAQEQLWVVQMLSPGSTTFHCPAAYRIVGDLDVERLSAAIDRASMRHAALRTVFGAQNGRPAQKAEVAPSFQLTMGEDLRAAIHYPLDLSRWAGAATLIRVAERDHIFVLVLHHLVTDGWSIALLLEEIARDYAGEPVAAPTARFVDLGAAQRRRLDSGELADSENFWKAEFEGAPAVTSIPADYARPSTPLFRRGRLTFAIPGELATRLAAMAQAERCTPNSLILSAFAATVQRHSGQRDLVLGVPYAGRDEAGSEQVQGLLMNLLALRIRVGEGMTFRELVRYASERSQKAYVHSGYPFSRLVQQLALKREVNRQPLVQMMYAPQAGRRDAFSLADLEVAPVDIELDNTYYDLTLCTWPAENGFDAEFVYAADLFSAATIEEFRDHFLRLLAEGIAQPERSIAELDLFSDAERRRLTMEWSGRTAPELGLRGFVDVFAEVAASAGDAEAIRYGHTVLTYRQLDEWSNRIAHALVARGLAAESIVALACKASPAAIAAILGAWKAGAAYLPLDPSYPADRLEFMRQDSGASLVIDAKFLAEVDERYPATAMALRPGLESPAYLIYTSGSTGMPKGVLVEHRGLAALIRAVAERYPLARGARVLQFVSLSFDVSVAELVFALTQAAALLIPARDHMLVGGELVDFLESERISQAVLPVSVLAQMKPRPLPHLIRVITGGERCPASVVDRWGVGREFVNAYGPTEASVGASAHTCVPGEGDPPIGYPLPGWNLYVLDEAGRVVPALTPGELYIGGHGLAREYWQRPELTAERFVEGTPEIAERLYRTGDRVRWRRDGAIEFLGRTDTQQKVRGFRIELGEVEAALCEDPRLQSAVAAVQGEGATARLVAYAVARASCVSADILARLRSRLPAQMVPSEMVMLDAMPLTPNGKVDRAALAMSAPSEPEVAVAAEGIEAAVTSIWQEVLGRNVARTANFFDAGGTSLLLVEVQARLEGRFGKRIPLTDLFEHSTIGAMARQFGPREPAAPRTLPAASSDANHVAIVGMAARFPKSPDIETYWRNLRQGVECITRFSPRELAGGDEPGYVPARGIIADDDRFDAPLFEMAAHEAERTDPQHRVWLECALAALEDAGCDPRRFAGSIGVFAGVGTAQYVAQWPSAGDYQLALGNEKDFVATRTSYKLGLRGPSLTLQTACSTSLVAVAVACQQLLSGECDVAIAGAASLSVPSKAGYVYREGLILSADGHCRPFDKRAAGTVPADGVGAVVLKRLSDAIANGDDIHAVIAGSAVNNDGDNKVGFTAPGIAGQKEVITRALERARVSAREVTFVEAHGTGTAMGDPVEFSALRQVFQSAGAAAGSCALGSVKSNLGHLDTAAGIAGLIKAVLAIQHGAIPGTLHFESPNPEIELAGSPFFVNAVLKEWESARRIAGVSSFGIGGSNAHVVVMKAPGRAEATASGVELLPISAATTTAVAAVARRLADYLNRGEVSLASVARTLQMGRTERRERRVVVASTIAQAIERLRTVANNLTPEYSGEERALAQLGAQWCAGTSIDWVSVRNWDGVPMAHLPAYPFERQRYWGLAETKPTVDTEESDWLYVPTWIPAPASESGTTPQRWLVFADNSGVGRQLAESLGDGALVVRAGDAFARYSEWEFAVDPSSRADMTELFQVVRPDGIVHAFSLDASTSLEALDEALGRSYFSVVAMAQAIAAAGLSGVQLTVLSAGGQAAGGAPSNPVAATVAALMLVVAEEYSEWQCRHIDLPPGTMSEQTLSMLVEELRASFDTPAIALRGGARLVRVFERAESEESAMPCLRQNGAYLITGGLGGIGLTLAEHLAAQYRANLVLVSRNGLPAPNSAEARLRLAAFQRVRQAASDLTIADADVGDPQQAREVVQLAIRKYGRLDGVIHAAGVTGGGALQRRTDQTAQEILRAKVRGTLALDAALAEAPDAFFFLCSSLTALAGVFGQADYTAANAFQDAFAQKANSPQRRVMAVNWDGWRDVGAAARYAEQESGATVRPLLHGWEPELRGGAYRTDLTADGWLVAEHRLAGEATVPGTAYVEIACEVALERGLEFPFVIRELTLLAPCALQRGESGALYTFVTESGEGLELRMESRDGRVHAAARLAPASGAAPEIDAELAEAAGQSIISTSATHRGALEFGPRWDCLAWKRPTADGHVGAFRLPEAFAGEAAEYVLHPALFDTLSGVVTREDGGMYLPFSYSDVTIYGPMGAEVVAFAKGEHSHLTMRVADRSGRLVAVIGDYALRAVSMAMGGR